MADRPVAVSQTARSGSEPLDRARLVRSEFIALTHDLPEEASPEVLRLWNVADTALLKFIRKLEADDG